jgi:phosphatidylserine/phosphatidylglycerophosphate/cardiolipin synthase-like enzyme
MTTPYFVPDEAITAALLSAARRGVGVTLILPAKNDSRLVHYTCRSHFDELLDAGVRKKKIRARRRVAWKADYSAINPCPSMFSSRWAQTSA